MARRRQLVVMINAEKQRLAKARDHIAQRSFKAVLKRLEAERARIDKAIDRLIEASPLWCAQQDLLKSVPGVGDVLARTYRPLCTLNSQCRCCSNTIAHD